MKQFPHSRNKQPGTWTPLLLENGVRSAWVTCPDCGESAALIHHTIHADGEVKPGLVCPTQGCAFNEQVKLEGWVG